MLISSITKKENNIQQTENIKPWQLLEEHISEEVTRLEDKSASGRLRPWNERAQEKERMAHVFDMLGLHYRADKMYSCGSWLKFLKCSVFPEDHPMTLADARFCHDKFCAMCNWRRSLKYTKQMNDLLNAVTAKRPGLAWVFLTLTVQNVHCKQEGYPETNELKDALNHMMESWERFAKDRQFRKRVVGWVRALEITVNNDMNDAEWYGSYHPHFHVLLAVDRQYFWKKSKLYLEIGDWVKLWQRCARLEYEPVVHVEKVKKIQTFEEMAEVAVDKLSKIKSPVLEVAKYPLKMTEVFTDAKYKKLKNGKRKITKVMDADEFMIKKRVWDLQVALQNRRLLGFGGLIKEVRKELQQQDLDKGDLLHIDESNHELTKCNCPSCGAVRKVWKYRFMKDGYIHGGIKDLVEQSIDKDAQ
jgi:plasmid rolling circle replication initiator protein Rep